MTRVGTQTRARTRLAETPPETHATAEGEGGNRVSLWERFSRPFRSDRISAGNLGFEAGTDPAEMQALYAEELDRAAWKAEKLGELAPSLADDFRFHYSLFRTEPKALLRASEPIRSNSVLFLEAARRAPRGKLPGEELAKAIPEARQRDVAFLKELLAVRPDVLTHLPLMAEGTVEQKKELALVAVSTGRIFVEELPAELRADPELQAKCPISSLATPQPVFGEAISVPDARTRVERVPWKLLELDPADQTLDNTLAALRSLPLGFVKGMEKEKDGTVPNERFLEFLRSRPDLMANGQVALLAVPLFPEAYPAFSRAKPPQGMKEKEFQTDLALSALTEDGLQIRYVPPKLLQKNPELIRVALSENLDALSLLPRPLARQSSVKRTAREAALALVTEHPTVVRHHLEEASPTLFRLLGEVWSKKSQLMAFAELSDQHTAAVARYVRWYGGGSAGQKRAMTQELYRNRPSMLRCLSKNRLREVVQDDLAGIDPMGLVGVCPQAAPYLSPRLSPEQLPTLWRTALEVDTSAYRMLRGPLSEDLSFLQQVAEKNPLLCDELPPDLRRKLFLEAPHVGGLHQKLVQECEKWMPGQRHQFESNFPVLRRILDEQTSTPTKPVAVILISEDDHNGAFGTGERPEEFGTGERPGEQPQDWTALSENYHIVPCVLRSPDDLKKVQARLKGLPPAQLVTLRAHGSPRGVALSWTGKLSSKKDRKAARLSMDGGALLGEFLAPHVAPGATVLLESCALAQGQSAVRNFFGTVAQALPFAHVFGYRYSSGGVLPILGDQGKVISGGAYLDTVKYGLKRLIYSQEASELDGQGRVDLTGKPSPGRSGRRAFTLAA